MLSTIEQFKHQGYFYGQSKFPLTLIDQCKDAFESAFVEKQKRFFARFNDSSNYSANHDVHRWNMLLPSDSVMMTSGFYADSEIFNLLKGVFENDFALVFFSSDISSPGSAFQTIHQDGNDFAVALNLPLVDANEINGSTHIYPNTHRLSDDAPFTNASNSFSDQEILDRAAKLEPLYLNVKKGDYTLRDLRLIHRGTPNYTNEHRPYLSAIFLPSSANEAPSFETIEYGLSIFKRFKNEAFPTGRIDLIDYANTFGRLLMAHAYSDRVARPIPKKISDQLSENALYCFRFAKFENPSLNQKIIRTDERSAALKKEIEHAIAGFEELKKQTN